MKLNKIMPVLIVLVIFSCTTIPEGVTAVTSFAKEKYLGKWYEIARLDFKYERDLNNTTAEYLLNEDGTIKVLNRGYNVKSKKWEQAAGKAKFVDSDKIAMLKVTFLAPFYSGYNVIAIDPDYKYSLVAGESLEYLWILSREQTIPEEVKNKYLKIAKEAGYSTSSLIWVQHTKK